jgi:SepF-like predicted cell division protein (DUF552 family)
MSLYTDHRDQLIDVQRQCLDGNTVAVDGTPIRVKIKELTDLVREERETNRHREAPLQFEAYLKA